jgi:hypothetical protein
MDKVKCPKRDLFTLLVVKVYNLENEFNFEIDNETLIKNKNQKIIKKYFTLESKKGLEDIINE